MIEIERYSHKSNEEWDRFVSASRNGTFLHLRGYMDYHSDRFEDYSLIARNEKGHILAVLPANKSGNTIFSHKGLTYGGWLLAPGTNIVTMTEIWDLAASYLRKVGFKTLIYKPVPHIFHKYPAEEDLYLVWRNGGVLSAVQASTVIDMERPYQFDMTARRKVRKAAALSPIYAESKDWETYWKMLDSCLLERHASKPVHTVGEMKLLHDRFPENIKLYTASIDGEMLAGVVMYLTDTTAHSQYIATSQRGRELNILPGLFDNVINLYRTSKRYFDFGTSNEDGGRYLNEGLALQKNGFGGRTVVFSTYELSF